ncbi:MAG: Rho termination factor N-terminal domain-containing protein [Deltaproteobacteria bacterium]|nr:Rho termination factor N-terminal domain-containing protein [Deltaproteobacteria bacterium]
MEEETKTKEEVEQESDKKEHKSFNEMTVKELREIARNIPDVSGVHSMKKEQLLEIAKESAGKKAEEPKAEEKEPPVKAGEPKAEEKEPEVVEELEEKKKGVEEEKEKTLKKMTSIELRDVARKIPGVTGATAMKKEQLIAVIKEARGIKDEKPVEKKKKVVSKRVDTVKELKQKVVQFKKEKKAALLARDRKKVDILRRRINRLKKRARKVAQA